MSVRIKRQGNRKHFGNSVLEKKIQHWRVNLVLGILLIAFIALIVRSTYLQTINDDFLQSKGDSRYLREIEISAMRGKITDRNGNLLAVSTPMKSIWALPSDAKNMSNEQKNTLAKLLEMSPREIDQKLATDKNFVYLKRQISPEIAQMIAELKINGIHQEKSYKRFYPNGEITAHIVGFTDVNDKGQEGIELAFEKDLPGKSGSRKVIRDRRGNIIEDVQAMIPPLDGKEINLSIDSKIQYVAYTELLEAIKKHKAKAGSAIVVDAQSGEILALVNYPTYNPNDRGRLSGEQLRNRAVTDSFEPGSTLKPFTVALALDKGLYNYNTLIDTSPGRMTIGRATISDSHANGVLTVAQVIQKSSNIGTAKISLRLDPKDMWQMFDSLGFGKSPNLGFPGESKGRVRPYKNWLPIEQATMSYGHGISVSVVQLAKAYTAFARRGEVIPLTLKKQTSADLANLHGQKIFSDQTVREMRAMLELATGVGGTSPLAQIPGYRIGGKTGTAHKIEAGGYVKKYITSFIGLAPIDEPKLIVGVVIDEPTAGTHYGGTVAGPVFSKIMGSSLKMIGVQPNENLVSKK